MNESVMRLAKCLHLQLSGDLRGHGRSDAPSGRAHYSWHTFGEASRGEPGESSVSALPTQPTLPCYGFVTVPVM